MRLLPGWLAFQQGTSFELDGDESIRRRPVDRIAEPLARMGARIEAREGRFPPFTVHGEALAGIEYELPVASAQVKSCVLLAGLVTDATTVAEPVPTRDHTERMLAAAGAPVARERDASGGGFRTTVGNADELELGLVEVPGDPSSAAFLIAAGVLVRDSRLVLERVGVNWTRAGFLRILERMGAIVLADLEPPGAFQAAEPIADIDVRNAPIEATTVEAEEVPLAIDELPLVALLGCFAEGETRRPRRRRAAAQGIRPDRDGRRGAARARSGDRGAARRLRRDAEPAVCAAGGSTATATIGSRCSARSPGSRPKTGSRSWGWRRPTCPIRDSPTTWRG